MRHKSALLSGLLGLAVLTSSPLVGAQTAPSAEDVKRAADAYDQGKRAYKDREWVAAAEHFETADRSAPASVTLELAMRAREKAKQLDRAATLAALALDRHPTDKKLTELASPILQRAEKDLHRIRVECQPACDIVLGTKLVHGGPAERRTVFVPAGEHEVRAGWSGGRSISEKISAKKAGKSELSFEAPPEETNPPTTPGAGPTPTPVGSGAASGPGGPDPGPTAEAGSGLPPVVFFVGAGLTVAAGAVTVWSGLDTQNNPGADRVREECAGQGTDCDLYQDGLSRQRRTNVLIGVTAGVGVVSGVIGAFFTNWSGGGDTKQATRIEPYVNVVGGASVGARGSF